ncbi:hypothetical protein ACQZ4X_02800 [Agrobacterium vitis]|uniref:hypothetical protein n=1 Tax=Agrobacterium vitis TaxID=373 RepID=UPI0012E79413|nr:hypothetical protein [Agrobacterium vitis]MVA72540.1 hypothetical protein [Agrobacterium vitis]
MTIFYAWVNPAFFEGNPLDHTWVTTYDNRVTPYATIDAVTQAGQTYWYCWGDFHPTGSTDDYPNGLLAQHDGNTAVASCLVEPNVEGSLSNSPPNGTILVYGVNGVCHQIANQVLYATKTATTAPLTVKGAAGYSLSTFLYGTYGTRKAAWAKKIATCTAGETSGAIREEDAMSDLPDDFLDHARQTLGDQPEKLQKLLDLRDTVASYMAMDLPGTAAPSIELINARNQHMLDQAADLLGAVDFEKVFGINPEKRVKLVHPSQLKTTREQK